DAESAHPQQHAGSGLSLKAAIVKVRDAMVRNVTTIGADAPIRAALTTLLEHGISGLPVIDENNRLVGMLTEGDLVRRAEIDTEKRRARWLCLLMSPGRLARDYARTHGRRVGEVMTHRLVTVGDDAPLDEVVDLMEHHHIRRVPVTRDGRLVGIVSRADLLRAFLTRCEHYEAIVADDATIERCITEALREQPWTATASIGITVRNGEATLRGILVDDRERVALVALVENVPGVRTVIDELTTIEPISGVPVRTPDHGPAHGC
ncbi:MAG TPA: CBS domain-containing protein, partial [Rudaea sp.]